MSRILVVCTTDSMIWNFLIPHIKELEKNGHYVECACSETGSFFNDLIEKRGIKMNHVCFKRTPYSFNNIKAYRQLCKIIKQKHFDVLFCHEPVGGALGRLAGHKEKCKVIYMAHGFHFYKGAPKTRKIYYLVEKFLSKYTDTLITINQEDYEASLSFRAKKCIKLNGVGIDTSKFCYKPNHSYLRNELGISNETLIFLSVGELIKRKNHEVFIRAVARLTDCNIAYVIAGEGPLNGYLRKLIKKLSIDSKVFLLGYRRDINELCNSSDVFVLPSLHEGLSVALMEAMACKKPIIGSNIRGNVDLIESPKGGFLANPLSVDDFVLAVRSMVLEKKNFDTIGEFNCSKLNSFSLEIIKKEILHLFE